MEQTTAPTAGQRWMVMGMREKLIELCEDVILSCKASLCTDCEHNHIDYPNCMGVHFADHLIANGVTIPVRCKDCKMLFRTHLAKKCAITRIPVDDDDFCSYGERRTDEEKAD